MKDAVRWQPTKFVLREGRLEGSPDQAMLGPASRFIANHLAPRYQELICRHASGRLLDLGAGQVPLYGLYRDLVDVATSLDWGQSAHASAHIDIEADLNQPLPLDSASYDTVLLTDVLEHVYRPHVLMAEIARVLAPGGKLLLCVPFFYWIHEAPHDYARYTGFMLRRLCEDNGLAVLSLEATGGSPEVVLDLVGKHLAWSNTLAAAPARVASWALRLPGVSTLSRYSSRWFPQGYALVAQRAA